MKDPRAVARACCSGTTYRYPGCGRGTGQTAGTFPPLDFEAILYGLQDPEPFEMNVLDWALEDAAPG